MNEKPFVNIRDTDGMPRLVFLDDLTETFQHLQRVPPQINWKDNLVLMGIIFGAVIFAAFLMHYLLEPCIQ